MTDIIACLEPRTKSNSISTTNRYEWWQDREQADVERDEASNKKNGRWDALEEDSSEFDTGEYGNIDEELDSDNEFSNF